ncbi:MAG: glycosyl transferase [Desulfurococcales archaeon ex4484_58]|nr:MAG: glycosyl transferase [Desulfurococcales archaeon ex4484_58]
MRKEVYMKIIVTLIVIGLLFLASYQYYSLAEKLYESEVSRNGKGYVSDEVWYVSSARNILEKVFKLEPKNVDQTYSATLVFKGKINKTLIKSIIKQYNLNIKIVDSDYHEIKAIYVETPDKSSVRRLVNILKNKGLEVVDIVWGWRLADARNINNYLNTEHPPMVKYLIALSMYLLGDHPIYWRIPSIVAGTLTVLFTFLAIHKLTSNPWLAIIIALFTAVDPIMRAMSSIGLLDIFDTLFTVIALYFVFSRKYYHGLIVILIGSLFKFNALLMLIPIILLIIRRELLRDQSFTSLLYITSKLTLLIIPLFLLFQVIVSIPLILHLGFTSWIDQSIFGAIRWHTTIKCSGAGCPISSAPWDWFIGNNGFPLYYFTWEKKLVALGFWPFWTITFTYMVFLAPAYRFERRVGYTWLSILGLFIGYLLLWVIGARSQYSFYSVQFTPLVYMFFITSFTYILGFRRNLVKVVYTWFLIVSVLWNFILELFMVKRRNL